MRFACDSCGAQYMIADEKVGDRGVKVKCKKCGNMIVVKPRAAEAPAPVTVASTSGPSAGPFAGDDTTGETTSVSAPPPSEDAAGAASAPGTVGGAFDAVFGAPEASSGAPVQSGFGSFGDAASSDAGSSPSAASGGDAFGFSAPTPAAQPHGETDLALNALGKAPAPVAPSGRPAGEKEWYVAIDDAQVGPIDLVEIEQRWDARELDAESLAWKAGMADWVAVADIPELAYLSIERSQQRPADNALGASKTATGESSASVAAYASTPSFASGSTGGGEAVAWTPSAASALSSLVQDELVVKTPEVEVPKVAAPDSLGLPSFGAGDLFGGAASTSSGGGADAPAAAAPAPMPVMPQAPAADPFAAGGSGWAVPQPRRSSGGSHTKIAVIAAVALVVVVAGAIGVVFVRDRQAEQDKQLALLQQQLALQAAKQAQPVAPPPQVVAQNMAQPDGQAAVGTDAPTDAKPSDGQPADAKPADAKVGTEDADAKAGKAKTKSGGTSVVPTKTVAKTQVDKGQTKKQGGGGDIDDILRESAVKEALTKDDIVNGVRANGAKLGPCIQAARAKGEVNPGPYKLVLDWTINPNGSVTNGRLKGPAEVLGTSLPACFSSVMGSWRFPASKAGAPVSNYPLAINVK